MAMIKPLYYLIAFCILRTSTSLPLFNHDESVAGSDSVIDCQVRTAIFDDGDHRRHSKIRRCASYADEEMDGASDMVYDLPQWISDRYKDEFFDERNYYLRIYDAQLARPSSRRQRLGAGSFRHSTDRVVATTNSQVEISEDSFHNLDQQRRTAEKTGISTVLVVRITTNDSMVGMDASTISDQVFGASTSAASQYKACSMEKKQLIPATGTEITNGVIEISVNSNIDGVRATDFENKINTVLSSKVGVLSSFDHILYCLPTGSRGPSGNRNWKAYSYVSWNRSFFNNAECGYLSSIMHEMGHSLGLGHSSDTSSEYGDQSGMMGASYKDQNWPLMCFNGAKNWQLGWYDDKVINLEERSSCGPWKGRLYGYPDYKAVPLSGVVIIRVGNIFIQYNKIDELNKDMQEKADVVAFTESTGLVDSDSYSLAGRGVGTWQHGNLVVDICEKHQDNGLSYYDIVVRTSSQASICNQEYTRECQNEAPTLHPTVVTTTAPQPTPLPTEVATPPPSAAPITVAPTPPPTSSPTTRAPTPPPSATPTTLAPTDTPSSPLPSSKPTIMPSESPTGSPSITESGAPSFLPSNLPSDLPSIRGGHRHSPSIDRICDDSKEGTFPHMEDGVEHNRTCIWLKANSVVQEEVCIEGHGAYAVCEATCGKCRIICPDTNNTFPYNGEERTCAWLASNLSVAPEVCKRGYPAYSACPDTCDACDFMYPTFLTYTGNLLSYRGNTP